MKTVEKGYEFECTQKLWMFSFVIIVAWYLKFIN